MKNILILLFTLSSLIVNSQSAGSGFNNQWLQNGNVLGNNTSFLGSTDNRSIILKSYTNTIIKGDSIGNAISYGPFAIGNGSSPIANTTNFRIDRSMTGAASFYDLYMDSQIKSDVTTTAVYFTTSANTATTAGTYTTTEVTHYNASQGTFGSGSTVTNQWGFVANGFTGASTINAGFRGRLTANSTRWNLYLDGSAQNYILGSVGIATTTPAQKLHVVGNALITGSLIASGSASIGGVNLTGGNPGVISVVTDITSSLNHQIVSGNPLASSSYIFDEAPFGYSTAVKVKNFLPQAITVTNWNYSMFINGTLGSTGNGTLILKVDGVNTNTLSTSITFTAAQQSFSGTITQTVNSGSYLSTLLITPSYTIPPTSAVTAVQYWCKRQ